MPRLLTATVALALVITGCSITTNPSSSPAGTPQAHEQTSTGTPEESTPAPADTPRSQQPAATTPFEIVAGGGTDATADKALDAKILGAAWDIEIAPDGTANLLINNDRGQLRLERIRPDGTRAKVDLDYNRNLGRRIAVGPDGSAYVNLHVGEKNDAIYRIKPDGSQSGQPVIDYTTATTGIDAQPGKAIGKFGTFTVDAKGRLVFAVEVSKGGHSGVVIRRLETDGTVRTIAGKRAKFTTYDAAVAASAAALHPPSSGAALDWETTAAVRIDELVTQSDGTILLAAVGDDNGGTARTILAITSTGKLTEVATSQLGGTGGAPVAPAPFTQEGTVNDIGVLRDGLAAAGGLIAVSTTKHAPDDTTAYYNGKYTPGQRAVLDQAHGKAIRLIRPDGSISTGALGAEFALGGGYLYVVERDFLANELVLGRVKIPA
ncbi:hypothetical protein GCM10009554_21350 [Kribbella koreensis]|uniref:Uncharacterized protein n=1 Tax=Kribbella koreensis TaxID=57909 RepID=A0ABN1PYF1_9ACTN